MWFGLRGRGATGARLRESIRERGYFVLRRPEYYGPAPASSSSRAAADPSDPPADPWTAALSAPPSTDLRTTSLDDLADAVDALVASGWPAVSVLAFDAAWAVIDRLFDVAEAALPNATRRGNNARTASKKPERSSAERGAAHDEDDEDDDDDPLVLEPSAFAWALGWRDATTPRASSSTTRAAVSAAGANFGLPHRDYPASEAWDFDADAPRLICAWVPLTDATPETGCVSVVPRDADDLWGEPGHPHHLAPAESVGTGGGGGGGEGGGGSGVGAAPGRGEGNYGKGDGGEIGGELGGGAGGEGDAREGDGVRRARRARAYPGRRRPRSGSPSRARGRSPPRPGACVCGRGTPCTGAARARSRGPPTRTRTRLRRGPLIRLRAFGNVRILRPKPSTIRSRVRTPSRTVSCAFATRGGSRRPIRARLRAARALAGAWRARSGGGRVRSRLRARENATRPF